MKFEIQMKDPDGVWESVNDAAVESVSEMKLSGGERKALIESRREQALKEISRWFEFGEYLTVEVDTEAGTCIVKEGK